MKITIVYDNTSIRKNLIPNHGFACIIEAYGKKILFDTGSNGKILLENIKKLNLDITKIDEIFISHDHWDHTGGLAEILKKISCKIYVPTSFKFYKKNSNLIFIDKLTCLHKNFFSTGTLKKIEQSLIIKTKKGLVIIVGCSHPGLKNILQKASTLGKTFFLIGGLHDFDEYEILKNLKFICPTHCTKHINEIKDYYPKKFVPGGVGQIIKLND